MKNQPCWSFSNTVWYLLYLYIYLYISMKLFQILKTASWVQEIYFICGYVDHIQLVLKIKSETGQNTIPKYLVWNNKNSRKWTDGHSGFGRSGFGHSRFGVRGFGRSGLNPEHPNLDIRGFWTFGFPVLFFATANVKLSWKSSATRKKGNRIARFI